MKTLKLDPTVYQQAQGDVLLTAASPGSGGTYEIPDTANLKIGSQGVALAYGEKEGHRHMLAPLVAGEEIEVYTQAQKGSTQTVTVFQTPKGGASLQHPEHGTLIIPGGIMTVAMAGQQEHSPTAPGGATKRAD